MGRLKILCFLFTLIGGLSYAQNFKEVSFITSDNITISASYALPEKTNSKVPAIILIHQGGSTREEWLDLPIIQDFLNKSFAVLAYDVRLHGESGKDEGDLNDLFNNPNRAPLDLHAAIKFLQNQELIDSQRIGVLGASIGANLACVVASDSNSGIKSVVSLSSKTEAVQNLSGQTEPIQLTNAFHIASKDEQKGMRETWAQELYQRTSGHKKIKITYGNNHGSDILRKHIDVQTAILKWFQKTMRK